MSATGQQSMRQDYSPAQLQHQHSAAHGIQAGRKQDGRRPLSTHLSRSCAAAGTACRTS